MGRLETVRYICSVKPPLATGCLSNREPQQPCTAGSRCWVVPHERIVRLAANVGDRQVQQPRDDRSQ